MAAELGQTEDPTALIPGSPATIEEHARTLQQHGKQLDTVGGDLGKIRVHGWNGAGGAAFDDRFTKEPPKWFKVSDTLHNSSSALSDYAETLRWAQSQATEAIDLWNRAEAASLQAKVSHEQTLADTAEGALVPPFTDPGDPLRQEANELLGRARTQLREAGDTATDVIDTAKVAGSAVVDALNAIGISVSPTAGFTATTDGFFGKLEAYAYLKQLSTKGSWDNGFFGVNGAASLAIGADATLSAGFKDGNFVADAGIFAGMKAAAMYGYHAGPLSFQDSYSSQAGLWYGVGATACKDGLSAHLEAFAGAKATVDKTVDLGGLSGTGHGEAWAGVGLEGDATFGKGEDGKYHIGFDGGAALGVGGKIGFDVAVDPFEVAQTAQEAAEVIGSTAEAVSDGVEAVAEGIAGWF